MGNQQNRSQSPTLYRSARPASHQAASGTLKPDVEMDRLSFSHSCGTRIRLDNNRRTAERLKYRDEYSNGVVITSRALKPDEMFQFRIDQHVPIWGGGLQFGVTTINPKNSAIPSTITDAISVGNETTIIWDGMNLSSEKDREKNYGKASLDNLQEGDIVGVKRTSSGELHFYVNGKDQGLADTGVPANVRGVLDLYGNAVKATIVDKQTVLYQVQKNAVPSVDNTTLRFHSRCGSNVQLVSNNMTAIRGTDEFSNALVMSNRKLSPGERFEVVIEKSISKWAGGLEMGVTQQPPEKITFPSTLTDLKSKCWLLTGDCFFNNGQNTGNNYKINLDTLVDGDTVGVAVMQNGDIHYYINGNDIGKAAGGIPLDVYAIVDLYGQTAQLSVLDRSKPYTSIGTPGAAASFDTSSMMLKFHQRCGQHASVINNQLTAIREPSQFNYGIVFTNRVLEPEELFQIEIEDQLGTWSGSVEMGVTTHNPNDPNFILPSTMSTTDGGTWMMTGSGIMHNGLTVKHNYNISLDILTVGDRVGCRVKSNGALHFYVNGMDLGAAMERVPLDVFGVIDVYGVTTQVGIVNTSDFSPGLAPSSHFRNSTILNTLEGINITFKTGSISQEKAEVIVNTTSKDLVLNSGATSRVILEAAGQAIQNECKKKAPNGIKFGDFVETSGGKMNGVKAIYHGAIAGWDGGKGERVMQEFLAKILKKAHDNGCKSIALPAIGTGILQFPPETVARLIIEEITSFSNQYPNTTLQDIRIVLFDKDDITLKGFESYLLNNSDVKREKVETRQIPRRFGGEVPDTWIDMKSDESCREVALDKSSEEYKAVYDRFIDKGGPKSVIKIERVQSPNMYQLFAVQRQHLEQRLQGTTLPAERTLYHGTASQAVPSINRNGFNRSYCGKNATRFGEGVYFAVEASYSAARTYSPPDSNGQRRIYVCKVLTGEYTTGTSNLKTPPPKDARQPNVLYDTAVDDAHDPRIFVTFHDANAYPEYLITFT